MLAAIATRIAFVVLGYFAAILAGSAAFPCALTLIGFFVPDNKLWDWLGLGPVAMIVAPIFFFFLMWITLVFSFVQVIVAHIFTEYFAVRSLPIHLAIAILIALSAGLIIDPQWFDGMSPDKWLFTLAALVGALVGGLVYWAIAGRNAGLRVARAA